MSKKQNYGQKNLSSVATSQKTFNSTRTILPINEQILLNYSGNKNFHQNKKSSMTVLVVDFEVDKTYTGTITGRKIAELLEQELYGYYQPLNRRHLTRVAEEIDFQNSDLVDLSATRGMEKLIGADLLITGTLYYENNQLVIAGRCIELKTGKLKRVARVSTSIKELNNALSRLSWLLTEPEQSFLLTQAKKQLKLRNYTLAIEFLEKVIDKKSTAEKNALLAYAQRMLKRQQTIALFKSQYDNFIETGRAQLRVINLEQAEMSFRQALSIPGFEQDELAISGLAICAKKYNYIKQYNQAKMRMTQTIQQIEAVLKADDSTISTFKGNEHLQYLKRRIEQHLTSKDALFLGKDNIQLLQVLRIKLQKIIVANLCKLMLPGKEYIIPTLGLKMSYIPAGKYIIGSVENFDEQPQHSVIISKGYWIGATEITQYHYKKICKKNSSHIKNRFLPVVNILWSDAVYFCRLLTLQAQRNQSLPRGYEYRLPTEAEWEIAASFNAKNNSKFAIFSGNNRLTKVGWYKNNSNNRPHTVGSLQPNAKQLYDMSGNVYEWCLDSCSFDRRTGIITDTYYDGIVDPLCSKGNHKIIRGGSYKSPAKGCRTSFRFFWPPKYAGDNVGFRIVLAPKINY